MTHTLLAMLLATTAASVQAQGQATTPAPAETQASGPAQNRRSYVAPYIEVQQVLDVPLTGDRDVLTYSAVVAGIEAGASSRRLEGTVSYRYERRFAWGGDGVLPTDTHNGLARGRVVLVPNLLTMEAGAIASRTRIDARGGGVDFLGRGNNVAQVYGGYVGPSLATRVGALDVSASYRFNYVTTGNGGRGGDADTLGFGQSALNRYDSSTSHFATAAVGMEPGELPVGWNVSGAYSRENAKPLDQRFENKFVRGQLVVPVSPTVALTAGVGYEDIAISQQAVARNPNGSVVVDRRGRFVGDRAAPRLIAYDFDGLFYDAGVIWRPSSRTTLIATVGKRYGQLAVNGTFTHQITSRSGITIGVYNGIDSFGRSIGNNLAGLPTQFAVPRTGFNTRFDGCVFGNQGGGGCFNDAFQSASTSNYRARGINALFSSTRGSLAMGVGITYDERRYLGPVVVASGGGFGNFTDRSVTAQANAVVTLDARSSLSNQLFLAYYDNGLPGAGNVLTAGATTNYGYRFTDRLTGNAAASLYASDQEDFDTDLAAQLLLGARYQF